MSRRRSGSSWLKNLTVPGWVVSVFRRRTRTLSIRSPDSYRRPEVYPLEDRSFFNSFMAAAAPLAVLGTGAAVLAEAIVRPAPAESLAVLTPTPSASGSGAASDAPSKGSSESSHEPTTIQAPALSLPSDFLTDQRIGQGTALAPGGPGEPGTNNPESGATGGTSGGTESGSSDGSSPTGGIGAPVAPSNAPLGGTHSAAPGGSSGTASGTSGNPATPPASTGGAGGTKSTGINPPPTATTTGSSGAKPAAAPANAPSHGSGGGIVDPALANPGTTASAQSQARVPVIGGVAPQLDSGPESAGDLATLNPNAVGPQASAFSAHPVRYFDGTVQVSFNDLSSDGFGTSRGLTRSWTNAANVADGLTGSGMDVTQLPHLRQDGGGTIAEVANGTTTRYFDPSLGTYTERYYAQDTLTDGSGEFVLTDPQGAQIHFFDYSPGIPTAQQGTFKSFVDVGGATTSVANWDGITHLPVDVERSSGSTVEAFHFTYTTSGPPGTSLISTAYLNRSTDGGMTWTGVQSASYAYYNPSESHGNWGDLKMVVVADASNNVLDTTYYRYYTGESGGYVHGLKYVFRNESYSRLVAATSNPFTASDSTAAAYADYAFGYDSSQRCTQEVVQGDGSSTGSTPGLGTSTYSYTASTNTPGLNSWAMKTVETQPDGNTNTVYTNSAGQVMLTDHAEGSNHWISFDEYDSLGHVILAAGPSAVTGYNDTYADLLHYTSGAYAYLSSSSGLLNIYDYATSTTATSTTAGDAAGYLKDTKVQQGQSGTAILVSAQQYFDRNIGRDVFPVATQTAYRNTDGTGAATTSYAYTWFGGTAQAQSMTATAPVVGSGQNGPGSADTTTTYYDSWGRTIWTKDGGGFLNYTAYDNVTGAVTTRIIDVDTTQTGEFTGLPSGWSTPSGGGLNLITSYVVDSLGRATKTTDPNGNVTYTVYDDPDHEVRTYAGWNSSTHTPTGPTVVTRTDEVGSYSETLTMSATPALDGSNLPTGTEAISGVLSLTRTHTTAGGQVDYTDQFFNLSGVTYSTTATLGTEGTNYYRTRYGYDSNGKQNRVQSPTGTITRTVSDGQGRVVSTWIGTNDTPTSGDWSPTNNTGTANMVEVSSDQDDGNGVGDGDLTQVTQYPGGGADNRVTQYYYDWRDRLVATKSGVQTTESTSVHRPIIYRELDNLGRTTATDVYDGDGVSVTTTSGVPNKPSSSLLRAYGTTSYDDQGRVYQSARYSVDPSSGSVSTYALTTNTWYDHRGNAIEQSAPGGLVTKKSYDGAGRATVTYTTDGAGGTSWSAASGVSSDDVLTQTETQYDADGNAILTTTRDRNHDETSTGALGNATTTPKARVSFTASYFDPLNRDVADVNVGTNGGSSYTRPSSVPTASDTVLVATYAYNSAGERETTTDPRGIVGKTYYDNLGRVTKTIEDYTTGTPTNSSDKTTEYTYDGAGHMLTLKADLASGYEQTQFVYGVTTSGGSAVNSNDILGITEYPDPSTGNPSTSSEETVTVNALGQTVTATDRDGNVHTFSYDVLGRQTSDAITTLGTGVDGSVRRIDTAYDTQGNAYLVTSYNASSGGSIVNQVEDLFNGLGQLTAEYQSHSGAVNTSTTPSVQYSYSLMSGGANHSRLTSVTYPNGRVVSYNYSSGLNDSISRLSSLSDSSGTLESYRYLGLGTVVIRAQPQANLELTYVKQSGESNGDAGDQYIGLDRFGRVDDQRWLNTSTGTATDRFQYGYDRDSNVLYKNNLVNSSFSELYHANGSGNGYDNLNQLTAFARGTLNSGNDTISSPSTTASWSMDAAGNFTSAAGTTETNNKQNQATAFGSATLTYDGNGNLTTDDAGHTLVYDAWNRLVQVKSGSTVLTSYSYDGLDRRVTENPGTQRDLYYSKDWQVLEERVGGNAQEQYVWSPVYVDALVERDRDPTGGGTLSERLWVQQDANWNVTALVNGSGSVVERYAYNPYGAVTYLSATWGTLSGSAYAWVYLHQGGRFDGVVGVYAFREREYSPTLGRWIEVDPKSFSAGDVNLYRAEGDTPTNATDPSGLYERWITPWHERLGNWIGDQLGLDSHSGWRTAITTPLGWTIVGIPDLIINQLNAIHAITWEICDIISHIANDQWGEAWTSAWVSVVTSLASNLGPAGGPIYDHWLGPWVTRQDPEAASLGRAAGPGVGQFFQALAFVAPFVLAPRAPMLSCFPAGTPVHAAGGLRAIEQIVAGDRVWAYDHKELRWAEREVVEVYQLLHRGTTATIQVKGETLRATGGHPFWVVRGEGLAERPKPVRIAAYETGGRQEGRWVLARDLQAGDEVLLRNYGVVALESVRLDEVEETVYNFQVAELQNYAVGECGVLVHNTNDLTVGQPPQGAKIIQTDLNGKWVIFEDAAGGKKIQFDVGGANNLAKGPLGPGRGTPQTGAAVGPDGKVVVVEGMHRLEAAQAGAQIAPGEGGIPGLPGWLEYDLWSPP